MGKIGKRGAIGLVLFVGILAMAKLALWLAVRQIVESGIAQAAPWAKVSYAGITTSFQGEVGLRQLRIEIPMFDDTLDIGQASLHFDSLGDLLRFRARLKSGQFPERLALSLKSLRITANGNIAHLLYDAPGGSALSYLDEVDCGDVTRIGTAQLLAMGYHTLGGNIEYAYRFDPVSRTLFLKLDARSADLGSLTFEANLANLAERPREVLATPPRLTGMTLEMAENGYQTRLQSYCIGRRGGSREDYLQAQVERLDRGLRSDGIALGEPLLEAYRRYLDDPRQLRLTLTPSEGLVWGSLELFKSEDVLSMLNPQVMVNHQAVEPLSFEWTRPASLSPLQHDDEAESSPVSGASTDRQLPHYEFVGVDSLPLHTGKRLQFLTFDGTYYQGVLRKVENGKAYLSVQFGTGSAEMFLRLNKIDKVRVLF